MLRGEGSVGRDKESGIGHNGDVIEKLSFLPSPSSLHQVINQVDLFTSVVIGDVICDRTACKKRSR